MLNLKEEIYALDWSVFDGPFLYNSQIIPSVLIELIDLDNSSLAEEVGNRVINAVGNDHTGVYYPVVLKVLDYIISIEKNTLSRSCKICALAILNDLYYFEPNIGDYRGCSAEELKKFVKSKLEGYSDENIDFALLKN